MSPRNPSVAYGRAVIDGVPTRLIASRGRGPVVLLLHGYTDSAHTWVPVVQRLGSGSAARSPSIFPGTAKPRSWWRRRWLTSTRSSPRPSNTSTTGRVAELIYEPDIHHERIGAATG